MKTDFASIKQTEGKLYVNVNLLFKLAVFGAFLIFLIMVFMYLREYGLIFRENKTSVDRLISILDSDTTTLEQKNEAVEALGLSRDKRALPLLKSLYTGRECHHLEGVCQYELKKAIQRINGVYFPKGAISDKDFKKYLIVPASGK